MRKWLPAAALLLLVSSALAQPAACGPTREVEAELARQYQERRIAAGEMTAGGAIVVYASKDGATWTAIREMPGGISCVLAVGEGWRVVLAGRGA